MAAQVAYDVTGFLEKNRDTLPPSVATSMAASQIPVVAQMFNSIITATGSIRLRTNPLAADDASESEFGPSLAQMVANCSQCGLGCEREPRDRRAGAQEIYWCGPLHLSAD